MRKLRPAAVLATILALAGIAAAAAAHKAPGTYALNVTNSTSSQWPTGTYAITVLPNGDMDVYGLPSTDPANPVPNPVRFYKQETPGLYFGIPQGVPFAGYQILTDSKTGGPAYVAPQTPPGQPVVMCARGTM